MRTAHAARSRSPIVTLHRTRRAFGLDAPRPPDVRRVEAAILTWLGAHIPSALPLRIDTEDARARPSSAATLALLLPGGRVAVLRIEAGLNADTPSACSLAAACRERRIPLARVASIEDARAALRRLGFEPEDS